jgi:hypothetical protein
MKLRPQSSVEGAGYPTLRQHKRAGGDFLRAAAALGLGAAFGTSVFADPPMVAGTPPVPTKPKITKPVDLPAVKAEDVAKQVARLTGQLGSEGFKAREAATLKLIVIGKGNGKCATTDLKTRQLVSASMAKCAKHEDPEVRERAKRVILALTPPKKVVRPPQGFVELEGDVMIEPRRVKGGR